MIVICAHGREAVVLERLGETGNWLVGYVEGDVGVVHQSEIEVCHA